MCKKSSILLRSNGTALLKIVDTEYECEIMYEQPGSVFLKTNAGGVLLRVVLGDRTGATGVGEYRVADWHRIEHISDELKTGDPVRDRDGNRGRVYAADATAVCIEWENKMTGTFDREHLAANGITPYRPWESAPETKTDPEFVASANAAFDELESLYKPGTFVVNAQGTRGVIYCKNGQSIDIGWSNGSTTAHIIGGLSAVGIEIVQTHERTVKCVQPIYTRAVVYVKSRDHYGRDVPDAIETAKLDQFDQCPTCSRWWDCDSYHDDGDGRRFHECPMCRDGHPTTSHVCQYQPRP